MDDITGLVAVICIFGLPMVIALTSIWARHRQQMVRIRMDAISQGDASVRAAVDSLREEVRALRDTSMQYDISFDTALQNLDKRVAGVENRLKTIEDEPPVQARLGR